MSAPEPARAQAVLEAIAALRGNAATARNGQPAHASQASAAHSGDVSARTINALRATALILADAREPIAITLRHELQSESGLSLPMIEWGLLTSLTSLRHAPLAELAATRPANAPNELIGVILAGNVFVAALRGIALPLLAGAHVIAKTSAREGAFARAFHAALTQADPAIAARLAIVQFPREDEAATQALCTNVDALSVYGSDETVAELRRLSLAQHAPKADAPRIIAHGHGLSAAYVTQSALQSLEQATHTAERIALDIAAYDQRGCLSPHFVLVEPGAALTPEAFAQLLAAQALPALAKLLPEGAATLDEQAERMQWQATAAVRGELYASSVSFEPAPLRPSPGGRLVSVYACAAEQLRELLEPFAKHLKSLGVAGTKAERTAIAARLQTVCSAQVCRSGEMQTPPFDAWADGAPPLAGFTHR